MEKVLDRGYVRTVNIMGTDLDVINSARVSFDKEVSWPLEYRDEKLIEYLIEHKHDSTLRHCVMTFEIYAPLMVARQWWKHHIGSAAIDDQDGWNESSRRYVTENEEFYVPGLEEWRSAPKNRKQGSGDNIGMYKSAKYYQAMHRIIRESMELYKEALADGIAPEQARLLLPAYAMYVRWRWTVSLNAVLHFISLRTESHAQYEIRQYAEIVASEVSLAFPRTYNAWMKYRLS